MRPFKSILCVIAADRPSKATLERAVRLAETNQARLAVMDTVPPATAGVMLPGREAFSSELQAAIKNDSLQKLQALTEPYQSRVRIQHEVLTGNGAVEIIRTVLRNGHDLLVKSAENPTFIERIFGSDDVQLLRACPCPVWIAYPEEKPTHQRVLAAVDIDRSLESPRVPGNTINQSIFELACAVALSDFSELHVAHVWDAPGESIIRTWSGNPDADAVSYVEDVRRHHQSGLDALREDLAEGLGAATYEYLSPRFHLRQGAAATKVPEIAKWLRTDLVVMGTIARTGFAGLLIGNTAEAILEQLTCSVLAVKPPDFVSPIKLDE